MITVKNTNRENYSFFSTIFEYVDFLEKTPILEGRRKSSQNLDDDDFYGTKNFAEAVQLCRFGDEKLRKQIQSEIISVNDQNDLLNKIRTTYSNDVVGFMPHVPNAVIGVPQNMIRQNKVLIPNKILNVYINMTAHCGIDQKDMRRNASKCAAAVNNLELQGYRCNLYSGNMQESDGKYIASIVKIKSDREPINLAKMAFMMAHPAVLRRFGFKFMETTPIDFTHSGYGRPMDNETKIREILLKLIGLEKLVVFTVSNNSGNIDNIMDRFKKGGLVR